MVRRRSVRESRCQLERVEVVARKWWTRLQDVRPAHRSPVEQAIRGHYELAGVPPPRQIVWAPSPKAVKGAGWEHFTHLLDMIPNDPDSDGVLGHYLRLASDPSRRLAQAARRGPLDADALAGVLEKERAATKRLRLQPYWKRILAVEVEIEVAIALTSRILEAPVQSWFDHADYQTETETEQAVDRCLGRWDEKELDPHDSVRNHRRLRGTFQIGRGVSRIRALAIAECLAEFCVPDTSILGRDLDLYVGQAGSWHWWPLAEVAYVSEHPVRFDSLEPAEGYRVTWSDGSTAVLPPEAPESD